METRWRLSHVLSVAVVCIILPKPSLSTAAFNPLYAGHSDRIIGNITGVSLSLTHIRAFRQ